MPPNATNAATIAFVELLETPTAYGNGRTRIARATAPNHAGPVTVRFPPGAAGEHKPHGKGDNVLVAFAYNDPGAAYVIASFAGGPPVQSAGNHEIHARGSASVRLVSSAGDCEVLLDGGGSISITASDGDVVVSADNLASVVGDAVEIDALSGVTITSTASTVAVEQLAVVPNEAVALLPRLRAELLALDAAARALAAVVGLAGTTAYDTTLKAAMLGDGYIDQSIKGAEGAINLEAEREPVV